MRCSINQCSYVLDLWVTFCPTFQLHMTTKHTLQCLSSPPGCRDLGQGSQFGSLRHELVCALVGVVGQLPGASVARELWEEVSGAAAQDKLPSVGPEGEDTPEPQRTLHAAAWLRLARIALQSTAVSHSRAVMREICIVLGILLGSSRHAHCLCIDRNDVASD